MRSKKTQRRVLEEAKLAYSALMKCYPFTTDDLDGEEWREYPNYGGGDYRISTFGRIKSLKNGHVKILKPWLRGEYMQIEFCQDGVQKTFQVNRLVAETFIPNSDNLPEVNHISANKLDNSVGNLEWVDHAQNMQHAANMGLTKSFQGEDNPRAKLTNEQIVYIRENPDNLTGKELAKMFRVSPIAISDIQTGKTYKNVGGEIRKTKRKRTPDEIRAKIRAEYKPGVRGCGLQALAKKYGLSTATVYDIIKKGDS